MSRLQNEGQNYNRKTTNKSSENVAEFRYSGMKVTNQNFIYEVIKSKLNSDNACYR